MGPLTEDEFRRRQRERIEDLEWISNMAKQTRYCGEPAKMVGYHRTTRENVEKILAEGFHDTVGYYLSNSLHKGVWISNIPLDSNEGAKGNVLLRVHLDCDERRIARYEWIQDDHPYREWLLRAKWLNAHCTLEVVDEYEDA
jgi:hypothetical protein